MHDMSSTPIGRTAEIQCHYDVESSMSKNLHPKHYDRGCMSQKKTLDFFKKIKKLFLLFRLLDFSSMWILNR